jgi:hypothetical protein
LNSGDMPPIFKSVGATDDVPVVRAGCSPLEVFDLHT